MAAHPDPIRIVPLRLETGLAAAPAAAAQLTYRGGPLLNSVEVFTLFWGSAWEQQPAADLAGEVNAFFDFILSSPLMDQLAEYGVDGTPIGHGTWTGTATVTTPALKTSVSDSAIRSFLEAQIAAGTAPETTANTLYFVYLPPGVTVSLGGDRSCISFCGYHDAIGGSVFYAVMPYPGCSGCVGGLQALDALTSTSSHELCEAVTDAIPGQGWYDDNQGEIGDICAWETKQVGSYTVQLEWSNQADSCV